MRKIAVFTGTRAEYGLLYWLLKDIQSDAELELQLLVSGSHLSPEFGNTFSQIEADGFIINEKIEMLLSSDTAIGVVKSMGLALIGYSDALKRMQPDLLVVLGDRFEALSITQAAMMMRIPVLHIHGGEITEGAYDDAIRHAITKMSLLHCTATEAYRNRVIQLGEHPDRVINVGAIGLDHLKRTQLLSLEDLSTALKFKLDKPFFLVTYHPVTLGHEPPEASFQAITKSLDNFPEHQVILTYPNADDGGRRIIPLLEAYAAQHPDRVLALPSLGQKRYLSAVKHAAAVLGNSSSGIIEVPSFNVPTVNIGTRQQGRLCADSVIHCQPDTASITQAIRKALEMTGLTTHNPYGKGDASQQIISFIKQANLDLIKTFYDLKVDKR